MSGFYDLVLLDRTLPDGHGLSLLRILWKVHPGFPVIILSARREVIDLIAGLDNGATIISSSRPMSMRCWPASARVLIAGPISRLC